MKRSFVHEQPPHFKYWTIEIIEDDLVVRCEWGRIGAAGQSKDWLFRYPHEAKDHVHRRIREKLEKGYREL